MDGITYGSTADDMLHCTERIINRMKRVIFWRTCSVCKAIGKFINDGLINKPEINDEHFSDKHFTFVISSVK